MGKASHEFQVFAKPIGPKCNLACSYCYYIEKERLYPILKNFPMSDNILEEYIRQHIETSPSKGINFSWHGGEPTLLGIDYFKKILSLEKKYKPKEQRITNGIQTNGTLLDDDWCQFLAEEEFAVGLSLDGPEKLHDKYRVSKKQKPTHRKAMQGYELLRKHNINCDILCVVHEENVRYPDEVYGYFKGINAQYIGLLPLVVPEKNGEGSSNPYSVPAEAFGSFLCTIFDEWIKNDIGQVKVQIFEEITAKALDREPALCIFRETCGDIPVVEHNGDFYSCDHYVDDEHCQGNIMQTPLVEMIESPGQYAFGQEKIHTLPNYCKKCEYRSMCNGGCPKDRIINSPDGEPGLNYLCAGYKRFFKHCQPFMKELSKVNRQRFNEEPKQQIQKPILREEPKIGRNDPCPCGSGRKYKKCCLGK